MIYYRLMYIFRKTVLNIREHLKVHLLSATTVGVTLTILGIYLLVHRNLSVLATQWGEQVQVVAYLAQGAPEMARRNLQAHISAIPGVEAVAYCSPQDAMDRLKKALGETRGILDGLEENPLPGSLEIRIKREFQKVESLQEIAAKIQQEEGVSDVQYGGAWIERLLVTMKIMRLLGISLGILLVVAALAIISNTLKLGFYTRRDEIEILRLVGASEFFIRIPFRLEAMLQGGVGATIALVVLWTMYKVFLGQFHQYWNIAAGWNRPVFLDPFSMIGLVCVGLLLGLVGSFFPMEKAADSR